jgi:hypothetical protein
VPSPPRSSAAVRCPTVSRQKANHLDDPDCISLRGQLFQQHSPDFADIKTSLLLLLFCHVREYVQQRALFEDYDEAKRGRDLETAIRAELDIRSKFTPDVKDEEEAIRKGRADFEAARDEQLRAYDAETDAKRDELDARQGHDRRVFERVWKKQRPHRYRKPSGQLLQMKQIEKSLALAGEIDAASDAHTAAASVARDETAAAQWHLDADYAVAWAKLLESQRRAQIQLEEGRALERKLLECAWRRREDSLATQEKAAEMRIARKARERSADVRVRPAALLKDQGTEAGTLLPPLVPPNDPDYTRKKRHKRMLRARQQAEFHRKNADKVLAAYMYVPPPEEPPKKKPTRRRTASSVPGNADRQQRDEQEEHPGGTRREERAEAPPPQSAGGDLQKKQATEEAQIVQSSEGAEVQPRTSAGDEVQHEREQSTEEAEVQPERSGEEAELQRERSAEHAEIRPEQTMGEDVQTAPSGKTQKRSMNNHEKK